MKRAPGLVDEVTRLETLRSYGILDTEPEAAFEDLAGLASFICGTPIALVSLVDENRQWFKSKIGMAAKETARDISFCSHAIEGTDVFVVNDAKSDERFRDNPLVLNDPRIQFYAGAPLIASNGHALGTLCVIDGRPRTLSDAQKNALEALARQVVNQIELRKMNRTLRDAVISVDNAKRTIELQQMKLVQAAKMKSLGEMAGGVAHEINTPLAIICAKATQLIEGLERGRLTTQDVIKSISKIESTSLRIARIVKGLLAFSRGSDDEPFREVALQEVVEDALALAGEKFRNDGVKVEVDPIPKEWRLECRATQITQVLLNLISNSYDAVLPCAEKWIQISASTNGGRFEITVTDSGPGIPNDVRAKLMEPFFTTKEIGQGTGLGLSISKGIVESHGGGLELDARRLPTRFVLTLPAWQARAARSLAA